MQTNRENTTIQYVFNNNADSKTETADIHGMILVDDGTVDVVARFEQIGGLIAYILNNTLEDLAKLIYFKSMHSKNINTGIYCSDINLKKQLLDYLKVQLNQDFLSGVEQFISKVFLSDENLNNYSIEERLWAYSKAHESQYSELIEYQQTTKVDAYYFAASALKKSGLSISEREISFDAYQDALANGIKKEEPVDYFLKLIVPGYCNFYTYTAENSFRDLIKQELRLMLQNKITIKKCLVCQQYFVPAKRSDQKCCNNINEEYTRLGKKWTCRQVAMRLNDRKNYNTSEAHRKYKRIYHMLFVRYGVDSKELRIFMNSVKKIKEDYKSGEISEIDYIAWLNNCENKVVGFINYEKISNTREAKRIYKNIYTMQLAKYGVGSKEIEEFSEKAKNLKAELSQGKITELDYIKWLNSFYSGKKKERSEE